VFLRGEGEGLCRPHTLRCEINCLIAMLSAQCSAVLVAALAFLAFVVCWRKQRRLIVSNGESPCFDRRRTPTPAPYFEEAPKSEEGSPRNNGAMIEREKTPLCISMHSNALRTLTDSQTLRAFVRGRQPRPSDQLLS
jgi:hypothetical protein